MKWNAFNVNDPWNSRIKGKLCRAIRPTLLYETKCWGINYQQENKQCWKDDSITMDEWPRWMSDHKRPDRIGDEIFRECWYTSYYEVDGRALLLGMYGKIPMEEVITLVDGRPYRE